MYYWFIAPRRPSYQDSPEREAAFTIDIEATSGRYELAVLCDEHGTPELGRLRINDLDRDEIPEAKLPFIQVTKEHLLSVLRLSYGIDCEFWPMVAWSFFEDGKPYGFGLNINEHGENRLDGSATRALWIHSFEFREALRLYVDGCDVKVPLQYRVLSLYKLIEDRYRDGKHWDYSGLRAFLAPHEAEFRARDFQGDLVDMLHALRDSCAHVRTGYKKQLMGVTHLNHKQAVRAERALEVLILACVKIINDLGAGKFLIGPPGRPRPITKKDDSISAAPPSET